MSKLFRLSGILLVISSLALSLAACTASIERQQFLVLTINTPQSGATITESPVTISGKVSKTATVKVNDVVVPIKALSFSTTVTLTEGLNQILVVATAARSAVEGEETITKTVSIIYKK